MALICSSWKSLASINDHAGISVRFTGRPFKIETISDFTCCLINAVGKLVVVNLRNDIKLGMKSHDGDCLIVAQLRENSITGMLILNDYLILSIIYPICLGELQD